jgi:hypothetical protein
MNGLWRLSFTWAGLECPTAFGWLRLKVNFEGLI